MKGRMKTLIVISLLAVGYSLIELITSVMMAPD